MSRKLFDKARQRLAAETGLRANPWGGRLSVALVYPNTYHHGMSNLGFQTVYHLVNSRDDTLGERFFLPDRDDLAEHRRTGTPLFSLESGKALRDFDLVAFSLSFENDYLNLPAIFDLGRLPWPAADRDERYPLVVAGGVCAFMNPEPLAEVMDLFAVGEAEAILPALLSTLNKGIERHRNGLSVLANLAGIYVPSLYTVKYAADGTIAGWDAAEGAPLPVRRVWLAELDSSASRTFVHTEATEFGDMALTEISRGCARGCRFCAAGFLFLPPRTRSLGNLLAQVESGLARCAKQGLVSPAVGDYPDLAALQADILAQGGTVSVASLRMDNLTPEHVETLRQSGHRTVSLAPEAGSQAMRDAINKGVTEPQILDAVRLIADGGIPNLKLYFLVGLPGETKDDVAAIVDLSERILGVWREAGRRKGRLGSIHLSVNPFVPKPFTPFQWAPMASEKELKEKIRVIRSGIARLPNVSVSFESVRAALLQGLLARSGRELGELIPQLASGVSYRTACRETGLACDEILHTEKPKDEHFPWELLDSGVDRDYLRREYEAARRWTTTPRCQAGCVRCGVC